MFHIYIYICVCVCVSMCYLCVYRLFCNMAPWKTVGHDRVADGDCRYHDGHFFLNFWPSHDDVIKWKHFPRNWPFVRGIHRSPVNSPHKGQWHRASMFSLMYAWINGRLNNGEAGDLRGHRAHYDVIVMFLCCLTAPRPCLTNIDLSSKVVWGIYIKTIS